MEQWGTERSLPGIHEQLVAERIVSESETVRDANDGIWARQLRHRVESRHIANMKHRSKYNSTFA
jgi:hypothetical protein